jgi:hypothetical protein
MNKKISPSKPCETCGKKITRGRDWEAFRRAKFCSKECYRQSQIGRSSSRLDTSKYGIKLCIVCKKKFKKGHRSTKQWNVAQCCSSNCYHKSRVGIEREINPEWREKLVNRAIINAENHKGADHPNWKGGISGENAKIRKSYDYNVWRQAVYKRDNWTCQMCKVKQRHPIAHHQKSFNEHPELRFEIDNGITVCRSCHKKIHKEIGQKTQF